MQKFKLKEMADRYGWDFTQLYLVADYIKDVQASYWFAGGALRRPILGQDTIDKSDFDIFFSAETEFNFVLAAFLKAGFKEVRRNDFNTQLDKEEDFDNEKADGKVKKTFRVQLIKLAYFNTLEDVLTSFDFTLCQVGWNPRNDEFICGDTALFDIANKKILINKITYPVASLRRLIKYTQQGFYACGGCLTHFLSTIQEFPNKIKDEPIRYLD